MTTPYWKPRPIPPKPLPPFEKFAAQVSLTIGQTFMLTFGEKVRAVVENRNALPPDTKADLVRNFRKLAKDAEALAAQIEGEA